jgi:flagellin-like protein
MGKMKANRKFKQADERAVSAVIGVILMVAITVAIAATVYVYVSGMVGGNAKSTPTISLIPDSSDKNVTLTVGSVSSSGVLWADTSYTLVDKTNSTQFQGSAWGTPGHQFGATANVIIVTQPTPTTVTGGQIITIKGTAAGTVNGLTKSHSYTFTLIYVPTGGTLSTATWTQ